MKWIALDPIYFINSLAQADKNGSNIKKKKKKKTSDVAI